MGKPIDVTNIDKPAKSDSKYPASNKKQTSASLPYMDVVHAPKEALAMFIPDASNNIILP